MPEVKRGHSWGRDFGEFPKKAYRFESVSKITQQRRLGERGRTSGEKTKQGVEGPDGEKEATMLKKKVWGGKRLR